MVDFEINPIKFEVSCCKLVMETHQNGEPRQNYVVDSATSVKSELKWGRYVQNEFQPKDPDLDRHVR